MKKPEDNSLTVGGGRENFDKNSLECCMDTEWAGHEIYFYAETDSTNLRAGLAAEGAAHGALFVADKQTAGKGRSGRVWSSPSGVNAYFTLLLKPQFAPALASMVTLVMGLVVTETLRELYDVDAYIKWPNDVVVKGRKVCGILTELGLKKGTIDYLVIGVGVNVGQQEFAPELATTATHLFAECGREVDRAELIAAVMKHFENCYDSFVQRGSLAGLRERYDTFLINRHREVRVLDPKGEYTGVARGITDTGELLVELPDGRTEQIYAGEVSVRGVYGYV